LGKHLSEIRFQTPSIRVSPSEGETKVHTHTKQQVKLELRIFLMLAFQTGDEPQKDSELDLVGTKLHREYNLRFLLSFPST
jgi:hypothetical protein